VTEPAQRGDRALCVVAHLSTFGAAFVLPLGLYPTFRRRRPWVAAHAAEAFNFHLTVSLLVLASAFSVIFLSAMALVAVIGLVVWLLVGTISRAVAAAQDTLKPYPGPILRLLHRPALLAHATT
jgi:uncharacterized Tic20 family protein